MDNINVDTSEIVILEFSKEHSKYLKKIAKETVGFYIKNYYDGREFTSLRIASETGEYDFKDKKTIFEGVIVNKYLITHEEIII